MTLVIVFQIDAKHMLAGPPECDSIVPAYGDGMVVLAIAFESVEAGYAREVALRRGDIKNLADHPASCPKIGPHEASFALSEQAFEPLVSE